MAETLDIPQGTKEEIYHALIPQLESIIDNDVDIIANMANISSCLKEAFGFWWVGFYRVMETHGKKELILGPFQGPLACTRIGYGRGVCGSSWKERKTIIVPDVEKFPGHIACSSASKSEIVVPIFYQNEVVAVLDIDSEYIDTFDKTDKLYLEHLAQLLSKI